MKKLLGVLMTALSLALVTGGALAQKKPVPPPTSTKPATPATKVTGIVKAAPAGKSFMIAQGKKTTTVDASGAKLRYNGKFFALDKLTAGSIVSAKGELSGTTLKAT